MNKADKKEMIRKVTRILKHEGGIDACNTILAYCKKHEAPVTEQHIHMYIDAAKRVIARESGR